MTYKISTMNSIKTCLYSLAIIIAFSCAGMAQQRPVPIPMSDNEIATAVSKIAALIREKYVFAEKGAAIALHLQDAYKRGTFRQVKDTKTFDSVATQVLRSFSGDGHLYVRDNPETVKHLRSAVNTKSEEGEDAFFYGPEAAGNNYGFREVKVLEGNIGYIKLSEINISRKSLSLLYAVMQFVSNTKALIIDLRNNGGGGSDVGAVFESYFLPGNMTLLEFKNREGKVAEDKTVSWLLQERYSKPLYILVNKKTASAAEAFAYVLQANKKATVLGQPSAGAANHNTYYEVNDRFFVSVSVEAPVLPGTNRSWEHQGVQPDHVTLPGEEFSAAMQLISEGR